MLNIQHSPMDCVSIMANRNGIKKNLVEKLL
jgi:hypothetical protein